MKKRLTARLLSAFLAIIMLIGIIPTAAFAASFGEAAKIVKEGYASGIKYDFNGYKNQLNLPHNAYGQLAVLRLTTGEYTYCIEMGDTPAYDGQTIVDTYNLLSDIQQDYVRYALVYGFNGNVQYEHTAHQEYAGTQAIIWAIIYNDFNNGNEALFLERMFAGSTATAKSGAIDTYNKIKAQILTHETRPEFNCPGNTATLKYNSSTGLYEAALQDSNGVLAHYNVRDSKGYNFSKNGNTLYISTSSYHSDTTTVVFDRTSNTYCSNLPAITLGFVPDSGQVNVVGVSLYDPIYKSLSLKTEGLGKAKIIKQSEDGSVSGVQFRITGNGIDEVVTTASDGTIVKENLVPGTYTISEILPSNNYIQPQAQTVTVQPNQTAVATFSNVLKKFKVNVVKTDAEKNIAQGDATLAGAVYGVYNGEDLVDTYTTDENGKFTTKEYVCGDNWSVREITPSQGYLLDDTVYSVGAEAGNFTVEHNAINKDVKETVIKGKIAIVKYRNDNDKQIKTPEPNARFEIYLKSAGSYANAKEYEKDILTTDADGNALSKSMPYGTYTVHQVKGTEGFYFVDDFDVVISENGKTYQFILNNEMMKSKIKIVKQDAETHKVIPVANVGFKIRNTDTSEYVTMHVNYPSDRDIDVFYTNGEGTVTLPERLGYGNYELIEVSAPAGYILNSNPIAFKADGTDIVVTKEDMPQKGKITIVKTGEVFTTVSQNGATYTPNYSVEGLKGTVFEVKAAEDIYTPDGTLRYTQGQIVDTVTTNSNGIATTKALYLGKYTITEKSVTQGYLIDNTVYGVELKHAGETASATAANLNVKNERQKVRIDLSKIMEEDTLFNIGKNHEIMKVKFGLYAAEDIVAKDGTKIPKNGLIETVSVNEEGKAEFSADVPFGKFYVKEISTDEHYILSDEKYDISFEYNGPDIAIVSITANGGEVITNDIIRGNIEGIKVDEDGLMLAGALMGLFRSDETVFTEETALMICESNLVGAFWFNDVPYGNFIIHEIKAPQGFVLSDISYPVSISENGETVEIEVENRFIVGSVQITKVDAEHPENKLTGAGFEVYADVDGNKEFNPDIDILVDVMQEAEPGIYQLGGLHYNGYFAHEKTAPEGFLLDDEYYYFEITEDGKTVIVENNAGVGFTNTPIKGELEITKTDVATGMPLANAGFRIKNSETGEVVAEGYTDENGIAKFTLRYGKYTYQEFDAPDGYEIDEREFSFEIKEDGETVKAQMTNTAIPAPKTGVDSPIGLYILIIMGSAGAAAGLIVSSISKNKKRKVD